MEKVSAISCPPLFLKMQKTDWDIFVEKLAENPESWTSFNFHDSGRDSSHLKPFPLFSPCSPIYEMVRNISVACLGGEILIFEVQMSKVFEMKKFVFNLQS